MSVGAWRQAASDLLRAGFGNPATPAEFALVILVSALAFALVMNIMSSALSMPLGGIDKGFAAWGASVLIMLLFGAVAVVLVVPHIPRGTLRQWLPLIFVIVSVPAAVAPFMWLLFRSRYEQALLAVILSVAAGVVVAVGAKAAFRAVVSGDRQAIRIKVRNEEVEQLIRDSGHTPHRPRPNN